MTAQEFAESIRVHAEHFQMVWELYCAAHPADNRMPDMHRTYEEWLPYFAMQARLAGLMTHAEYIAAEHREREKQQRSKN